MRRHAADEAGASSVNWWAMGVAALAAIVLAFWLIEQAVATFERGTMGLMQVALGGMCLIATGGIVVGLVLLAFKKWRKLGVTLALPSMSFWLGIIARFVLGSMFEQFR